MTAAVIVSIRGDATPLRAFEAWPRDPPGTRPVCRAQRCAIKHSCTTGKGRLISRWEHEHVLEAVQRRLDEYPEKMPQRRETVEHPFGTIKARMGATHFLMKTLPRVAAEMALHLRYAAIHTSSDPVMKEEPSLARNKAALAISPASPKRKRWSGT
jgi:Transposase DDE domain